MTDRAARGRSQEALIVIFYDKIIVSHLWVQYLNHAITDV
jgi:hypothetical protein